MFDSWAMVLSLQRVGVISLLEESGLFGLSTCWPKVFRSVRHLFKPLLWDPEERWHGQWAGIWNTSDLTDLSAWYPGSVVDIPPRRNERRRRLSKDIVTSLVLKKCAVRDLHVNIILMLFRSLSGRAVYGIAEKT